MLWDEEQRSFKMRTALFNRFTGVSTCTAPPLRSTNAKLAARGARLVSPRLGSMASAARLPRQKKVGSVLVAPVGHGHRRILDVVAVEIHRREQSRPTE